MDDELPFEEFDDLMLGTRVMAPWCASGDDRINFAEATVVENEKQSPRSGHRGYCILLHKHKTFPTINIIIIK